MDVGKEGPISLEVVAGSDERAAVMKHQHQLQLEIGDVVGFGEELVKLGLELLEFRGAVVVVDVARPTGRGISPGEEGEVEKGPEGR